MRSGPHSHSSHVAILLLAITGALSQAPAARAAPPLCCHLSYRCMNGLGATTSGGSRRSFNRRQQAVSDCDNYAGAANWCVVQLKSGRWRCVSPNLFLQRLRVFSDSCPGGHYPASGSVDTCPVDESTFPDDSSPAPYCCLLDPTCLSGLSVMENGNAGTYTISRSGFLTLAQREKCSQDYPNRCVVKRNRSWMCVSAELFLLMASEVSSQCPSGQFPAQTIQRQDCPADVSAFNSPSPSPSVTPTITASPTTTPSPSPTPSPEAALLPAPSCCNLSARCLAGQVDEENDEDKYVSSGDSYATRVLCRAVAPTSCVAFSGSSFYCTTVSGFVLDAIGDYLEDCPGGSLSPTEDEEQCPIDENTLPALDEPEREAPLCCNLSYGCLASQEGDLIESLKYYGDLTGGMRQACALRFGKYGCVAEDDGDWLCVTFNYFGKYLYRFLEFCDGGEYPSTATAEDCPVPSGEMSTAVFPTTGAPDCCKLSPTCALNGNSEYNQGIESSTPSDNERLNCASTTDPGRCIAFDGYTFRCLGLGQFQAALVEYGYRCASNTYPEAGPYETCPIDDSSFSEVDAAEAAPNCCDLSPRCLYGSDIEPSVDVVRPSSAVIEQASKHCTLSGTERCIAKFGSTTQCLSISYFREQIFRYGPYCASGQYEFPASAGVCPVEDTTFPDNAPTAPAPDCCDLSYQCLNVMAAANDEITDTKMTVDSNAERKYCAGQDLGNRCVANRGVGSSYETGPWCVSSAHYLQNPAVYSPVCSGGFKSIADAAPCPVDDTSQPTTPFDSKAPNCCDLSFDCLYGQSLVGATMASGASSDDVENICAGGGTNWCYVSDGTSSYCLTGLAFLTNYFKYSPYCPGGSYSTDSAGKLDCPVPAGELESTHTIKTTAAPLCCNLSMRCLMGVPKSRISSLISIADTTPTDAEKVACAALFPNACVVETAYSGWVCADASVFFDDVLSLMRKCDGGSYTTSSAVEECPTDEETLPFVLFETSAVSG